MRGRRLQDRPDEAEHASDEQGHLPAELVGGIANDCRAKQGARDGNRSHDRYVGGGQDRPGGAHRVRVLHDEGRDREDASNDGAIVAKGEGTEGQSQCCVTVSLALCWSWDRVPRDESTYW